MRNFLFITCLWWVNLGFTQQMATMMHDGSLRVFHYYIPSNLQPNESVPLLIALHGLTQTGSGLMDITQFNTIAEAEHFIVCYPSGLNNAWNANMNVTVSTADDQGFIEKLVDYFETNYTTNPTRRYLCGMSNGGFMSHKLVCESSYCFAAIASVSGVMSDTTFNNCNPQFPTAVLQIHGTADALVPYDGSGPVGSSVTDMLSLYQQLYGANPTPIITAMPNTNLTDMSYPELHSYTNGTAAIRHVKIYGGGHQWPGISTVVGGTGTINMDFYSPQFIWDFLSTKSCAQNGLYEEKEELIIASDENNLRFSNLTEAADISIYNTMGLKVYSQKTQAKELISIVNWPKGMYFIECNHQSYKFLRP
jgi:polyhydroxybutyrate depolymerase